MGRSILTETRKIRKARLLKSSSYPWASTQLLEKWLLNQKIAKDLIKVRKMQLKRSSSMSPSRKELIGPLMEYPPVDKWLAKTGTLLTPKSVMELLELSSRLGTRKLLKLSLSKRFIKTKSIKIDSLKFLKSLIIQASLKWETHSLPHKATKSIST